MMNVTIAYHHRYSHDIAINMDVDINIDKCCLCFTDIYMYMYTCTGCTVYVQGSGKTFTMLGSSGGKVCDVQYGLIPKAASELFFQIARLERDAKIAMGIDTKTMSTKMRNNI